MRKSATMLCATVFGGAAAGNDQVIGEEMKQKIEDAAQRVRDKVLDGWPACQEEEIDWQMPDDTNPPEPIFNRSDNRECRETVNGWYSQALQYHKEATRLNKSYTDVLERQSRYGIELVNNQEFYEWASLGIGEQEVDPFFAWDRDYYSQKFIEVFGSHDDWEDENGQVVEARPIRNSDELDSAMYILYQFRYFHGLEDRYHWGRRMLLSFEFIEAEDYAMCSENTRELAAILASLVNSGMQDWRDQYYYPLLDNMVEWLDQTYG